MFYFYAFFLLFGVSFAFPMNELIECPLRSGAIGVCKPIHKCHGAMPHVNNGFGAHSSHSRCGYEGGVEIICCQKSSNNGNNEDDDSIKFPTSGFNNHQPPVRKPTRTPPNTGNRITVTKPPRVQNRIAIRECERYKKTLPLFLAQNIFNGELVEKGEIPHMAALGYEIDNALVFDCGGTLISDRFVLTAAHCILNNNRVRPSLVRMGTVSINGTVDTSVTDYTIKDIKVHPSYQKRSKYNDIALLELSRPVKFSSDIYPACIYTRDDDPTNRLTVAGWGMIGPKKSIKSNLLLKASLNTVPRSVCVNEYADVNVIGLANGITEQQICAADPERDDREANSKDTCPGDSGGPLQMYYNGMPCLVGVTSFSRGECGLGVAGVYVRVSKYLDWIEPIVWPN